MIVDGKGCALGRLGAFVAEQLKKGEKIIIINAEEIRITGKPEIIIKRYMKRRRIRNIANPSKSPKYPRRPDLLVKRTIRGMIPWRTKRGRAMYRNLRVYMGEPEGIADKVITIGIANPAIKSITVKELCKALGWS